MTPSTDLLQAADTLARTMGEVALRHYRTNVETKTKADGSPVTVADREAEEHARAWLSEHFADDGIVGEEFGEMRPDADRMWYIDPIDGTRTFIHGVPLWGSLVGVVENGRVVAGAASFPAVSEHLAAARGAGCRLNGVPCRASDVADLRDATVLTTDERFYGDTMQRLGWNHLGQVARTARTWGDCYGYLLVATGRAEVMLDGKMNPWDAAAVAAIVNEAGGRFSDWHGKNTIFGRGGVATNAALDTDVRRRLATAPGARESSAPILERSRHG